MSTQSPGRVAPPVATTPVNPGIRIQLAIHGAVRRDAERLSIALARGDAAPVAAVRAFWSDLLFQLHHHHEFEDTSVWPRVRERLGGAVDALLDRNLVEHEAMAEAMAAFGATLATDPLDPVVAHTAADRMRTIIEAHLDNEEADVLPLLGEGLTPADYPVLQAEGAKGNPPEALLPWLLDDADAETVAFYRGNLPEPVIAQLDEVWAPRRKTLIDALSA